MRSSAIRATCPAHLNWALRMRVVDARYVCLFQDCSIRNFVLPADVQEIAETSEVEMIDLPLVFLVYCPGFAAIE